jgi:hypothetical protein
MLQKHVLMRTSCCSTPPLHSVSWRSICPVGLQVAAQDTWNLTGGRFCLAGFEVLTAVLATFFTLVSSLAYSSTLKMEATCSSELSVDFQRTTRHYIPEDGILHKFITISVKTSNPTTLFSPVLGVDPRYSRGRVASAIFPKKTAIVLQSFTFPKSVFLKHFPYFEKMEVGLSDHHTVCVCVSPPINF